MYPWAVNFRALGWLGFFEMVSYLALIMAGFLYIIKKGVLKWE
jgi:NADH-quinone oxidoreductase subunit A